MIYRCGWLCLLLFSVVTCAMAADDGQWTRFRGPNGSGVSPQPAPAEFGSDNNIKWKAELPGPGLSSPVIIGDKVVVTCWTGYATGNDDDGELEDLKRNVVCLARDSGKVLWSHAEPAVLPEDEYRGMFAQNGYASHTPTTDGERVYVFFGKTGVLGFDLATGKKLWQTSVGENRERRGWGTASSPIVYGDMVIVAAFIESDSLVALDGKTGKEVWRQEVPGYTSNWSTPILVNAGDRTELVLAVPGEVWGLNPENGKLRWYCAIPGSDDARSSPIAIGDVVIAMAGGRGASTSIAVRAGGRGDVEQSHRLWQGRDASGIATPVAHDGRLYVVNNKVLSVVDLKTGDRISQRRLSSGGGTSSEQSGSAERSGSPGGRGGGYRFGRGGQDYSSPVIAGERLYYCTSGGDIHVYSVGDELKQVAVNNLSDGGLFNATPAISNGQLFIRSTKALYCVAAK